MVDQRFTEHDWELFRAKIAGWQEACIEQAVRGYIELLNGGGTASDKFWKLDERIREDKQKAGVMVEMRRSAMMDSILRLLAEGAIRMTDLDEFSDGVRETAKFFFRYKRDGANEASEA